jgi:hypothetical protein
MEVIRFFFCTDRGLPSLKLVNPDKLGNTIWNLLDDKLQEVLVSPTILSTSSSGLMRFIYLPNWVPHFCSLCAQRWSLYSSSFIIILLML